MIKNINYKVIDLIGIGTKASVWLIHNEKKQKFALKFYKKFKEYYMEGDKIAVHLPTNVKTNLEKFLCLPLYVNRKLRISVFPFIDGNTLEEEIYTRTETETQTDKETIITSVEEMNEFLNILKKKLKEENLVIADRLKQIL